MRGIGSAGAAVEAFFLHVLAEPEAAAARR